MTADRRLLSAFGGRECSRTLAAAKQRPTEPSPPCIYRALFTIFVAVRGVFGLTFHFFCRSRGYWGLTLHDFCRSRGGYLEEVQVRAQVSAFERGYLYFYLNTGICGYLFIHVIFGIVYILIYLPL